MLDQSYSINWSVVWTLYDSSSKYLIVQMIQLCVKRDNLRVHVISTAFKHPCPIAVVVLSADMGGTKATDAVGADAIFGPGAIHGRCQANGRQRRIRNLF